MSYNQLHRSSYTWVSELSVINTWPGFYSTTILEANLQLENLTFLDNPCSDVRTCIFSCDIPLAFPGILLVKTQQPRRKWWVLSHVRPRTAAMLNLHPLCIITVVSTLVQFSPGLSFPCWSSDVNDFALTSIISPLLLYHTFNFLSRRWLHLVLIKSWVVCYSYLTEKKYPLRDAGRKHVFNLKPPRHFVETSR